MKKKIELRFLGATIFTPNFFVAIEAKLLIARCITELSEMAVKFLAIWLEQCKKIKSGNT